MHISNTPPESLLGRIKWVPIMIAMLGTHVQTTKNKQLENMRKEGKPYGKKTPPQKENLTIILQIISCMQIMSYMNHRSCMHNKSHMQIIMHAPQIMHAHHACTMDHACIADHACTMDHACTIDHA